jgi:hypothetical protein
LLPELQNQLLLHPSTFKTGYLCILSGFADMVPRQRK